MRVELREHPAHACRETRMSDGSMEVVQLYNDDGSPVPLLPDQHGIYFQADEKCKFACVGYCLKAQGKPICLIEHFPEAVAKYIHAEVDRQRGGGTGRLAMISAPMEEASEEVEEEESPLILPTTFIEETEAEAEEVETPVKRSRRSTT